MNTSHPNNWKKRRLLFIPILVMGALAISALVMFLWNAVLTDIARLPRINYGQALGLFILCRILFGRFSFKRPQGRRPPFANPSFRDRFIHMTDEEKQRFKEQWKERCSK
jgi:hypothetical protein